MSDLAKDSVALHIAAALAPHREEALLARSAIDAICGSPAGQLPAAMTSLFGFECRLGRPEPVADFLLRTGAEPGEWPVLERYAGRRKGEVWRRIVELLRRRAMPGSIFEAVLRNLWLEFDLADDSTAAADPSVFFGSDSLVGGADTAWAEAIVALLQGATERLGRRPWFVRLVDALPASARLFQVGVMCARPCAPLRICVIGQELDAIAGFLLDARWPGDIAGVARYLKRIGPTIDHVALDFDVTDDGGLLPRIGIELYQAADQTLVRQQPALIALLCEDGLCLPGKAAAVLAWSGITHQRRHPDLWPPALLARREARNSTFCRWLHHVKVTLEADGAVEAKVYLAVAHAFLDDAVIRELIRQGEADPLKPVISPRF